MTTWKYPNAPDPTVPGTETNVTPDNEVPIIPNATSIQLEFLLPIKKESLFEFREVYQATANNNKKYPITKENNNAGDISKFYLATIKYKTLTKNFPTSLKIIKLFSTWTVTLL
jgi:hypothetical protein